MFDILKRKKDAYDVWRAVVADSRPELAALPFKMLDHGIFQVGTEVIKFNKNFVVLEDKIYANDVSKFDREWRSQDFFFKEGLFVPEVTFVDQRQRFFSMTVMSGEEFVKTAFYLRNQQLIASMRSVGSFIGQVAVHGAKETFNKAALKPITRDEGKIKYFLESEPFQAILKDNPCLAEHFNDYAISLDKRPYVVVHADLHNKNIFAQKAHDSPITGVIDWGNVAVTKAPETELLMAAKCLVMDRHGAFYPAMTEACTRATELIKPRDCIIYKFISDAHAVLHDDENPVGRILAPKAEAALRVLERKRGGP